MSDKFPAVFNPGKKITQQESPVIKNIDENILGSFLSSFADDTRLSKGVSGVILLLVIPALYNPT